MSNHRYRIKSNPLFEGYGMANTAFLATGSEICQGDVLNTNSFQMAQALSDNGVSVGMHLNCNDCEEEIAHAIKFLLKGNQSLIITGGLGPTSDDRTRYALASVINQPLTFHKPSWDSIVTHLQSLGLNVSDSNKQQAFFPESATILKNKNGSANACLVCFKDKDIYLLPGPPHECLPIFEKHTLPKLKHNFQADYHQPLKWRVFGVSEGEFAEKMDNLLKAFPCRTAYRWFYPYIDFKVEIRDNNVIDDIKQYVYPHLSPYLICQANKTALEELKENFARLKSTLTIFDKATGGLIQSQCLTPENSHLVHFASQSSDHHIEILGLDEYWKNINHIDTSVELRLTTNNKSTEYLLTFPFRQKKSLKYAAELIAYHINQWLSKCNFFIDN